MLEAKRVAVGPARGQGRRAGGQARGAASSGTSRRRRDRASCSSTRTSATTSSSASCTATCPGSRRAKRDDVCQAGFVVRRRYTTYPQRPRPRRPRSSSEISVLQIELAKLERTPSAKRALRRWETFPAPNANGAVKLKTDELRLALQRLAQAPAAWAAEQRRRAGASRAGSRASDKGIGNWQIVEEEPQTLLEDVYPLYPLVPNPNDTDARRQRLDDLLRRHPDREPDTDPLGISRFDDHHLYEIRCFVRRHKRHLPAHGRSERLQRSSSSGARRPRSTGWRRTSIRSGTSHRPVNVQLPDFPTLAAQVAGRPVGA